MKSGRVLIAPLDWGLGHATRCIPIINLLLEARYEVILAGSGLSLQLLKMEFPTLHYYELPSYNPAYSTSNTLVWKMAAQLRKFIGVIKLERDATQRIVERESIEIVISDNRYGCYSSKTKNIFISHQLTILTPRGLNWLASTMNRFNRSAIEKFDCCWIPDYPEPHSLSGKLSATTVRTMRFIGPLSRFVFSKEVQKEYDLLILLSGPEPQRGMIEKKLFDQLKDVRYQRIAVVRGTDEETILDYPPEASVFNLITTIVLEGLIARSEIVVARSGYSTIMDLAAMRKKAVFIPTPGQTEQVYLAKRIRERGIAYSADQADFNLSTALYRSKDYTGFTGDYDDKSLLRDGVLSLRSENINHNP